jgi:hypothetical protein
MKTCFKLSVLASALALAMGPASALDVYLAAKPFLKSLPMSGGTTVDVPMWGYVEDTGGVDGGGAPVDHCYDIIGTGTLAFQARLDCVNALTTAPAIPGPRIDVVDPADPNGLRIYLTNGLPEPTSIVIPGQKLPFSSNVVSGPTWNDGTTGSRTGDNQRVRSYGVETAANGGRAQYIWNNTRQNALERNGTFIYHSGTWPQKQVYMGLYGAVTKDVVAADVATGTSAEAYAGVPYDNEVVLFYSDVDPVLNNSVACLYDGDGTLDNGLVCDVDVASYTTSIDYHAQWFLVNGEPYEDTGSYTTPDIPAGSAVTGPGDTRSNTLVRLLSTASETHVPTLQGLYMTIHAEDGFRYTWQEGDLFGDYAPREQYSAMLPPLKTKDAIVVASAEGRYAVYDGNGYMTNPSDPNDFGIEDELGGMLRFLAVGPTNQAPIANPDSATTPEDFSVDINVLLNDSDPNGDPLTIVAVTQGSIGSVTISNPSCCVLYTPNLNANGLDSFTYTVSDSNGVTSTATAVVDVTVTPVNDAPSITSTPVTTGTTSQPYSYTVTATDVDLGDTPPDVLTFSLDTFPAGMTIDGPSGVISWTPTVQQDGLQAVTVRVTDSGGLFDTQTFSIDVTLVNVAPVITSAPVTAATVNAAYSYDVDATDADLGDTQTYALDVSPAGMSIDSATGVISWTPTLFQLGDNSVTVSVTDFHGLSATQAYTVTVVAAGTGTDGPLFFVTSGNGAVPGVSSPYNNADIYAYDGAAYQRILAFVATMGFNANVDALDIVDGDTFYISFANTNVSIPGFGTVQDEDVLLYDAGTWSVYFDGTAQGLTANGHDIDAISIDGGMLYFSTTGNANVGGLGAADDADIYSWNGATFARVFDASTVGLPGNANIDGLTVRGGTYYMSFVLSAGTNVPTLGTVQDEAVVSYSGGTWNMYFSGPGLNASNAQNVGAFDLP